MPKETKVSPIINLSVKMNTRSNSETLDVDANATGLELFSASNMDLFYTKSVTSREGLTDVAGGIVNSIVAPSGLFDTVTPSGTINNATVYLQDQYYDREGILFINNLTSQNNVYKGTVWLRGFESTASIQADWSNDLQLNMWLHQVKASAATPGAGDGLMNASPPSFPLQDIALGSLYNNTNPTQLENPVQSSVGFVSDCRADAISKPTIFNLGTYSGTSGNWSTPYKEVEFEFYAPYAFIPDGVYYLKMVLNNTSGTGLRGIQTRQIQDPLTDFYPNAIEAQERIVAGSFNRLLTNISPATTKTWLRSTETQFPAIDYMLVDYPESNYVWSLPAKNGVIPSAPATSTLIWQPTVPPNTNNTFNGLTTVPLSGTTDVMTFGNLLTVPSGVHTIQGGYCMLGILSGNGWSPYTVNKSTYPIDGYNVGYTAQLSEVTVSGLTWVKGAVLASYSGNHVFNDPYTYVAPTSSVTTFDPTFMGTQTSLDKVYAIFDNPVTINNTGNKQYMLSFTMFDFNTTQKMTDYIVKTSLNPNDNIYYYTFTAPILLGMNVHSSAISNGDYFGKTNDNINFQTWGTSGFTNTVSMACGLISVASGNAITSLYDYRVGDSRTQEVIFTQRDKVQSFNDADPANTIVTLWSGAAVDNNYKWSHSTYQGLLFSHQYSKSSGVCWDQIYYNPSGLSMQYHGLRPVAVASSGNITLPVGATGINLNDSFDIILATTMNTGGFRSSEIIPYSGSAVSGNAVSLVGIASGSSYPLDIQFSGINDGTYQYNFDVNPLGTYVFATQPSGAVWFYAPLCDSSGLSIPNPLPNINTWNTRSPHLNSGTNGGTGVYIFDNSFTGANSIQVPNKINYDQTYLINQKNVAKFKKTIVFKNSIYGIGDVDNPSRLWYSEIQGPQIFGVDTNFYGFYDIDNDNGQELTGIEIFKDYLIIFKENSTYRASFTANPGNPLEIFQVSNTKGCLGIFTTVSSDYGVFGLNQYGPFLASYAGIENIGDEIYPYFQDLDRTDLIFSVAVHDVARQQVYWSISDSNQSPDNQKGLVYSYAEKAWGIRQNGMWNAAGKIGDTDNFTRIYIGDTLGQIKQLNSGEVDQDILFTDSEGVNLNKNISLVLETPWLNFGNSQNLKQLKFVKINCDTSNQKLRIDVYTDQNSTRRYSRFLNMNVPVINRVCSLASVCRTVKLVITSVGQPDIVKLNSIQFGYIDQGMSTNIM